MAWGHSAGNAYAYAAEGDDLDLITASVYVGVVNVTRQTARVQSGAAGYDFEAHVNGNRPLLRATTPANSGIMAYRGYFGLDVAPTSAMALLYGSDTSTGASGGKTYCEIGTDRKIRFYDKGGNQVGNTSTTLIPTAGLQEVTIVVDALTLPTVWISLSFGTTEEVFFDTGLSFANWFDNGYMFWGEALAAGVNRGCHLYADDLTSRKAGAAADAPHTTAYPRLNIFGGVNLTTAGTYLQWDSMTDGTVDSAVSSVLYIDTGELPTHDGDTSHLQTTVIDEKFTFLSTAANPTPAGFVPAWAAFPLVLRLTGAAKGVPVIWIKLGADEAGFAVSSGGVSTTFVGGQGVSDVEPDGTAWERADADASTLEIGCRASATDPGARVTLMVGPWWVGSTANLSLLTTPVQLIRRRGGVVG